MTPAHDSSRGLAPQEPLGFAPRMLAVVVLYKLAPEHSSTLETLLASAARLSRQELELKIVLWDNTPGGQEIGTVPEGVTYIAAPENPGLAVAYNAVTTTAEAQGYEWLLTLDQDSVLPPQYLAAMAALLREWGPVERIGAIVPQVISAGRTISPFHFLLHTMPRWFPRGFTGVSQKATYAANSGSVLRVSALRQIGGYDPLFPLDLSDTSMFHRLHASGKRVFVAGHVSLQHDFALLNKQGRMSLERYDASLRDDCAFWDLYMGPAARLERVVRFSVRALKECLTPALAPFRRRTLFEVRRRLLGSRKARLEEWRAWCVEKKRLPEPGRSFIRARQSLGVRPDRT